MAGAEVVYRQGHAQVAQAAEQVVGGGVDQFALGQLQHQLHRTHREGAEEVQAIGQQAAAAAIHGADVDAQVETLAQQVRVLRQLGRQLLQERAGHGHDQAALLGQGDEDVRADQPRARVAPAHQHLGADPAAAGGVHQRLEEGHEFAGVHGPLDLAGGRRRAPQHPVATEAEQPAKHRQHGEQRPVVVAHHTPLGAGREATDHLVGKARRGLARLGQGEGVGRALVHLARLVHPARADPDQQFAALVHQLQDVAQVAPVHRRQHGGGTFGQAVHDQRGVRRHRIAGQQVEAPVDEIGRVHRFVDVAEQRTAEHPAITHQVDGAHEGHGGDLLAQHQLGRGTGPFGIGDGGPRRAGGVAEHDVDQVQRLARGEPRFALEADQCLPIDDAPAQQQRQQGDQQGNAQAPEQAPDFARSRHPCHPGRRRCHRARRAA